MAVRIGVVGIGKIARDQHLPAIAGSSAFELVGVASSSGDPGLRVPWFRTAAELYAGMAGRIDAVSVCTPPMPRYAIARDAMLAGLDVLLEKPPAATLGEVDHLKAIARQTGQTLYATWHAQHAPGVAGAAAGLADQQIASLEISWLEDVRKWHPGQEWIWAAGNFGVFDPGINGLSIATRILPMPLFVREARLVVPADKQAPIAATLRFGENLTATFDWRYQQGEKWTMTVRTGAGRVVELCDSGARLIFDGVPQEVGPNAEYPAIYARFAELIAARKSDVDREPLRIVADAFMIGHRELTEPFG
jgi:D-galactose 1-dehydrogenase